jgi:uncharacterized coiled-coil DUF342 family protein
MSYVRGKSQQLTIPVLQAQIRDMHRERESLRLTIAALSRQVQVLNAIPVNFRRADPVCGTYSGYQKHIRDKATPCLPCKAARSEYTRNYRKARAVA